MALTLERQVQATSDERIARARLNQLMDEPLSTMFALDPTPSAIAIDITNPADLEDEAVKNRPEVALAVQQEQLAAATVAAAQAAFLPQVVAQGAWELNGGAWSSRSSSWVAGAAARINVFHGFADKARLAEARKHAARRALEKSKAETMARLDVRTAIARLEAARASETVGRAAAATRATATPASASHTRAVERGAVNGREIRWMPATLPRAPPTRRPADGARCRSLAKSSLQRPRGLLAAPAACPSARAGRPRSNRSPVRAMTGSDSTSARAPPRCGRSRRALRPAGSDRSPGSARCRRSDATASPSCISSIPRASRLGTV